MLKENQTIKVPACRNPPPITYRFTKSSEKCLLIKQICLLLVQKLLLIKGPKIRYKYRFVREKKVSSKCLLNWSLWHCLSALLNAVQHNRRKEISCVFGVSFCGLFWRDTLFWTFFG